MEREKEKTLVLFLMIVCGGIGCYWTIIVVNSDLKASEGLTDIEMYYAYRKFDYVHGLHIVPLCLFFVLLLVFLDVPSIGEAGRVLYSDLREKILRDLRR